MLQQQNRVIIVDDRQDQLMELGEAFLKIGVGCRIFNFHDGIDAPLTGVRYAFFDINLLSESSQFVKIEVDESKDFEQIVNENSAVLNNLVVTLSQYISIDNGPFILIFWTRNKHLIKYLKFYINQRELDTPNPLRIGCFDKQELLGNETAILEKLQGLFNDETIRFPFAFENTVFNSAVKTTNQVFSLINQGTKWGDSTVYEKSSKQIFSKIAASTLGLKHAQEEPEKAINEGLLPILNHEILNAQNEIKWAELLKPLYNAKKISELAIDDNTKGKLNTVFHIDKTLSEIVNQRGSLFEVNQTVFDNYSNLEYAQWFSRVLPGLKRATRESSVLICVEISAACDYSQQKPRILKYMLGALILSENYDCEINTTRIPQNSLIFETLFYNGYNYNLCLDMNSTFSVNGEKSVLGDKYFTLKKEIMNYIGNRYANHVSRIGITSF